MNTQRWTPLCGDCWALAEPDQYFPEATDARECVVCGQHALTVNVHPEIARKASQVPAHDEPRWQR